MFYLFQVNKTRHRSSLTAKNWSHGMPVIKVLSYCLSAPNTPFFTLPCDTAFGTMQTTFLLCQLLPSYGPQTGALEGDWKARGERSHLLFPVCFLRISCLWQFLVSKPSSPWQQQQWPPAKTSECCLQFFQHLQNQSQR